PWSRQASQAGSAHDDSLALAFRALGGLAAAAGGERQRDARGANAVGGRGSRSSRRQAYGPDPVRPSSGPDDRAWFRSGPVLPARRDDGDRDHEREGDERAQRPEPADTR